MGMRWCLKYKINVEEMHDSNCLGCVFAIREYNSSEQMKILCQYNEWYPGLIRGRSWQEIEELNKEIEGEHDDLA